VTERELVAAEIAEVISGPAENFGVIVESVLIRGAYSNQMLADALSASD
jgi:hypothetical protein